jgi:beta-fructofuranosidase
MEFSRRNFLHISGAAAVATSCNRILAFAKDPANGALCRKLASDPLRPQYHLMPAHNWMNDPNGPIFYRGRYHMFHQYNPQGAIWGNMNWAHATSPDMLHWRHEPIAISPTPNGYDRDGAFSGSAVVDHGRPTVIYTGVLPATASGADATLKDGHHVWREVQCLAVASDEDLLTWNKLSDPVIAAPLAGLAVTGFRDPYVWREGDNWMLILGSGFPGKGGAILLYASPDLRRWTYLHPLVEGAGNGGQSPNPVDTGEMWECPDFFPLGDKHVLLISTMGKVRWKVGSYEHQRFTPEREGVVDWGSYYAAKTMLDENGNRILWGWIPETRPDADLIAAGWAGAMSLPRTLSLKGGELCSEPAAIIQKLRGKVSSVNPDRASIQSSLDAVRIHDLCAEIALEVRPRADNFTLRLQSDAGDFVTVSCGNHSGTRQLLVNSVSAPLPGLTGSPVKLHMFLDGSVLEIFANDATALTARVYQIPSGPLRLKLDGDAELLSLAVWQMTPISNDRLTGSLCSYSDAGYPLPRYLPTSAAQASTKACSGLVNVPGK